MAFKLHFLFYMDNKENQVMNDLPPQLRANDLFYQMPVNMKTLHKSIKWVLTWG